MITNHLLHMNSMLHWSPCNMNMKGPIFIDLEARKGVTKQSAQLILANLQHSKKLQMKLSLY